jgi:uncharacterized protein
MESLSANERFELHALVQESIHAYRELLGGAQHAYGSDRDYYRVLGYKHEISTQDYHDRYERGDIAARIVDLPAQDTWRRPPLINENGRVDTPFVEAWVGLTRRLRVWPVLARLDRLCGIGRYGILVFGAAKGRLNTPLQMQSGPQDLRYVRPFAELHAEIIEVDENSNSPRYCMPTLYKLTLTDADNRDTYAEVHHTRVLHVADNKLDGEIYGVPRLKKIWNRLDDMVKLVGGAAEATWLNMRRGTVFQTREGYRLSGSEEDVAERQEMIRQYVHDMARILVLEGLEAGDLGSTAVDPTGAYQVSLAMISAATGIPQRILVGSAQGELAAAQQDTKIWYDQVAARQVSWAEPEIVRPCIDKLIEFGMLPPPENGYSVGKEDDSGEVRWPSLWQISEVERAAISMNRGQAIAATRNPVTGITPVTLGEIRNILGLPYDMPDDHPLAGTPPLDSLITPPNPDAVTEQESPGAELPTPASNLNTALHNYEQGHISAKQLAQFAALAWARAPADNP